MNRWIARICCLCCAVMLAAPAAAAQPAAGTATPPAAQTAPQPTGGPLDETNCLRMLLQALRSAAGVGFVQENGQVYYCSEPGVYSQFTPGFVSLEGGLYHVQPDGFSFTQLQPGFTTLDGVVCYSTGGTRIQTFTPGFVTLDGQMYRVAADGFGFECRTAGLYNFDGEVYCVPEDGAAFLVNDVYNGLEFGPDGRYTTGSAQLDALVKSTLAACTTADMTQEQKLRAAYLYLRDNGRYLARSHYARGSVDWVMSEALFFLQNHRGNCYSFAGAFMYLARQLGYEAYPVSGGVGYANSDHSWVMIPWWNGVTYLFDVELEYAYRYRYEQRRNLNLYQTTPSAAPFVYTFPR